LSKKMKAGVLKAVKNISTELVDVPQISDDEVLVKVGHAGICGTDFERVLKTGTWRFPTVLGHEFGGTVVEVGSNVKNLKVGDKVAVNPMVPCLNCDRCKRSQYNMCRDYDYLGSRSDGGFAEYAKVRWDNAYKVPENFTFDQIASVDPVAVGLHGIVKGRFKIGQSVAILGAGPIGHYMVQWAKMLGASVIFAVDIVKEKLDIANEVGADVCINATEEDVTKKILALTGGEGVDLAIESAGAVATVQQAIQVTRKQGNVVLLGTPHQDVILPDKTFEGILRRELNVIGAWCYHFSPPINEWTASIKAIADGNIRVEPVITHHFPLDAVDKAFKMVEDKNEFFNKIIITVEKE